MLRSEFNAFFLPVLLLIEHFETLEFSMPRQTSPHLPLACPAPLERPPETL